MNDIDKYIGWRIKTLRQEHGLSIETLSQQLGISQEKYRDSESGIRRFHASELFELKRRFDFPLKDFFTHKGEYLPDAIVPGRELSDLIFYFQQIECSLIREKMLGRIKNASSVF